MNENYRNGTYNAPYRQEYEDPYDDGYRPVPARELATFPPSVENRLAQARNLLSQGQPGPAAAMMQQAGAELARTSPEHFMLMALSEMGVRQVTFEDRESEVQTTQTDSYFMGVRYGQNVRTVTTVRMRQRTVRLG